MAWSTETKPAPSAADGAQRHNELPDVLIQNPARSCAYLIPAAELSEYRTTPETLSQLTPSTITFVIPDESFVEEVPPFRRQPNAELSVLIQDPRRNAAYILTQEQLERYRCEQPKEGSLDYGISFAIPYGMELIQELPALRQSLLQNQESGSARYGKPLS